LRHYATEKPACLGRIADGEMLRSALINSGNSTIISVGEVLNNMIKSGENMSINSNPVIIAEIGCNHKGDMEIAREMIKIAAVFCRVDVVKFQKRTIKELLTPEEYNRPHPNPSASYGSTYGEHREFLELDPKEHAQLKAWCEAEGVTYSTSVWDLTAAKEIVPLNPAFLKIPSASNLDFELLRYVSDNYGGEIHVSLGMTTHAEEERIVQLFEEKKRNTDLVIYACTSGYPVPFEDICLLEISRLKNNFGARVKDVGFSGHHLGIAADVAAVTLGARYFERHFTLDRTWKGTDHAASLEPDGMRKLARDLRNVKKAIICKSSEILEIEMAQRKKLKRKLEAVQ
jgi:N-acetylneuraminate synthase